MDGAQQRQMNEPCRFRGDCMCERKRKKHDGSYYNPSSSDCNRWNLNLMNVSPPAEWTDLGFFTFIIIRTDPMSDKQQKEKSVRTYKTSVCWHLDKHQVKKKKKVKKELISEATVRKVIKTEVGICWERNLDLEDKFTTEVKLEFYN